MVGVSALEFYTVSNCSARNIEFNNSVNYCDYADHQTFYVRKYNCGGTGFTDTGFTWEFRATQDGYVYKIALDSTNRLFTNQDGTFIINPDDRIYIYSDDLQPSTSISANSTDFLRNNTGIAIGGVVLGGTAILGATYLSGDKLNQFAIAIGEGASNAVIIAQLSSLLRTEPNTAFFWFGNTLSLLGKSKEAI